ncbi:MAG: ImmA/IrrE family metallo-endopeptidase [Deltaproteobacteria bacterium]|nr:MAG: ImmA/IrrE family metallo-endopeptidase [Deltaproteobacteria bacterium]
MSQSFSNLREVRERLLGYRLDFVSRATGLSEDRLHQLEQDQELLTAWEAEVLGRVYGLDPDSLSEFPIRTSGDAVTVLQQADEFRQVSDATRLAIVAVGNAARTLHRLRRLLGPEVAVQLPELRRRSEGAPHRQGSHKAALLRRLLNVRGSGPIPSMRDFVKNNLPSIVVLYAQLGPHGPAGVTFGDPRRAPTIVLNAQGKNQNPLVRRFSLAHELCHVLLDWNQAEPLALLSGYLTESGLEIERRANAFAVRLLCPEQMLNSVRDMSPHDAAKRLLEFGLPYAAVRLYLRNETGLQLPRSPDALGLTGTSADWIDSERPDGLDGFPLSSVPLERRTAVAEAGALAYSTGRISRDAFAEALGISPIEDLETVLDYFAIDPPVELSDAA